MDDPDQAVADQPTRIFVLDDHELVRRGLVNLMATTPDLVVVGEAAARPQRDRRLP